jgi:hypothetical protein
MTQKLKAVANVVILVVIFLLIDAAYSLILQDHPFNMPHYSQNDIVYFSAVGAILTMLLWHPVKRFFNIDTSKGAKIHRMHGRSHGGVHGYDLHSMTPGDFEQYMADLMARSGYRNVSRVGGSSDLTIDIVAISVDGQPVIVQCKRYAPHRKVGTPELQQFIGMAYTHHGITSGHAMFVTTSHFTEGAKQLGYEHNIIMIDADILYDITNQYAHAA